MRACDQLESVVALKRPEAERQTNEPQRQNQLEVSGGREGDFPLRRFARCETVFEWKIEIDAPTS